MSNFYQTTASYRWLPSGSIASTKYDDFWFAIVDTTEKRDSIDPNLPLFKDLDKSYESGEINQKQHKNLKDCLATKLHEIYAK